MPAAHAQAAEEGGFGGFAAQMRAEQEAALQERRAKKTPGDVAKEAYAQKVQDPFSGVRADDPGRPNRFADEIAPMSAEERRKRAAAAKELSENTRAKPQVSKNEFRSAGSKASATDEFTLTFGAESPLGLKLKDLRVGFELGTTEGTSRVLVSDVTPGGQADQLSKVSIDDIVVAVDGVNVERESAKQITQRLAAARGAGRPVDVTFKDALAFNAKLSDAKSGGSVATTIAPATEDGGEIALEWYECCDEDDVWNGVEGDGSVTASLPSDAPVVCVMHTLTGTSADFVVLAREAVKRGFRPVVCLRRGHLDAPLRTAKFNLLGNSDDLDVHLEAIRVKYPSAKLFGYGESAGTGLAVRYSGEKGVDNPFVAIACVCPGYDTTEGGAFSRFEPLLDRHLLKSVKDMFLSANETVFRGFEQASEAPGYDELINAPDMAELQRRLYGVEGYASLDEYHDGTNPMGTVRDIAVPMLVINSDDDPICAPSNVDDNLWAFEGDVDRALVRTPCGTHCCFYEGRTLRPRSSWAHEASLEFFESVLDE